jgi:gliding motility-associated-like protein
MEMRFFKLSRLFILFLLTLVSSNLKAADWYVNNTMDGTEIWCTAAGNNANPGSKAAPFATLTYALTQAGNNDRIYVDAGNYYRTDENITVTQTGLSIIGAGSAYTIFDDGKAGGTTGRNFIKLRANNIVLKDFYVKQYTLRGTIGEAIDISGSAYTGIQINGLKVDNNGNDSGSTFPIEIKDGSQVTFRNGGGTCNIALSLGGGIQISGASTKVDFYNYLFVSNDRYDHGGALRVNDGTVNVYNSLFSLNNVDSYTGCAFYQGGGTLNLYDCIVESNTASIVSSEPGGIIKIAGGNCRITRSKIQNNNSSGYYGTIGAMGGTLTIDSTYFNGNTASRAKDIYVKGGSVTIRYCTFTAATQSVANQSGPGITISNSGSPALNGSYSSGITLVNTTVSSYSPNPTVPTFSGTCGTGLKICNPAVAGVAPTSGCDGLASLSATAPSGSVFSWYNVSSGGSVLDTTSTSTTYDLTGVSATKTYYVVSNLDECKTRTPVTVTYNCPACTTTITYPSTPYCQTGTATPTVSDASTGIYSCTVSSTGTLTDLAFVSTATGVIDLVNSKPGTYTVQLAVTGQPTCNPTTTITIEDSSTPTGSATQTFCSADNKTVADLVATGNNIKWYPSSSGGTAYNNTDVLTSGHYYATQTNGSCESSTRLDVTVTINDNSTPTGSATQSFCSSNNKTVADLVATGNNIQWYSVSTGGSALPTNTVLTNGHYYASQTNGSCESTARLDVTVTINDNSTPTGSASQSFCSSDNKTVSDLVATGNNIKWYPSSSGGTAYNNTDVLTSGHYYATQTNGSCESSTRLDVTVTINDNSTPTGSATQSFCSSDNKTVADLVATGNNIQWYSAPTGGTALPTNTVLSNGHYYATQTNGSCESTTRFDVTVTINDNSTPTGSATQTFCSSNSKTVADLVATGNNIQWYSSPTGGTVLPINTILTSGHYYATQTNGTCESTSRLDVTVTVINNSITATEKTQSACLGTTGVATVSGSGTGDLTWTGTANGSANGVTLNYDITGLGAGTYNITFNDGTCTATTSVSISNLGAPSAPNKITSSGATTFCQGGSITLTASTIPGGATINWTKDGASFGNANDNPITVTASGTYSVTITVAGCTSAANDTVVTVTALPNTPTTTNATPEFCASENAKISDLSPSGASIKWYNQSSNGTEYTDLTTALVDGQSYYASQTTSGCESSLRTQVTPKIYANPTPTWTASPGATSCLGDTITYNSQQNMTNYTWAFPGQVLNTDYKITSGGTTHIVKVLWLTSGSKTVNLTYTQDFGTKTCSNTTPLTNTTDVKTLPVPTFTVAVPATYCTDSDLKYRTEAGFSNYTWTFPGQVLNTDYKIIAGANTNTITIQWLTSGSKNVEVAYSDPVSGCMSKNNPIGTTTINTAPSAPTSTSAVEFCSSDNATLDMVSLKLTGTSIKWYNISDVVLSGSTSVQDQQTYYATQTVGGCESKTKLPVLVTVNTSPGTPSGAATAEQCKVDNPTVADLLPTSSTNTTIDWYFNGTLQNYTDPLQNGVYMATAVSNGCESASQLSVTVTVYDPLVPADPTTHLCANNNPAPMLFDIYQNSPSIQYYATSNSVAALSNQAITKGQIYYVRSVEGACLSLPKQITVPVFDGPTLSNSPYTFSSVLCERDKPTFDDVEAKYNTLPTNSGTIYWYLGQNDKLTDNLPKNTQITSGNYWIAVKDVSGCYSTKQMVTLSVDAGKSPDLKPIELCASKDYIVSDLNVSDLTSPTGILTWYYGNNGTNVAENTLKVLNNVDYWATYKTSANACESNEMKKLTISWVSFNQKLALDDTKQKFCKSQLSYVSDLSYSPYTTSQIGWFEDDLSTSPLPLNTELNEMTYFAAEYKLTSDGKYCVSSNKDQVDVTFYTPKMFPTLKASVCTKKNGSIEFVNPPVGYTFDWYQLPDSSVFVESGAKYSKSVEKESFKIVIKDAKGCTDSIYVSMPDCTDSPIPQILTPDGNGDNDKWVINYSSKYKEVQVKIFNRWGGEVYSSPIPYTDDWDGKSMSGGFLPTGTYYYVIDKGNGEPVESGYIELVK